jgi:hypothetical protein
LGGVVVEGAVGTDFVVVAPPGFNLCSCVRQVEEPVLVQAFVPELAVEAFDEGVLDGLAGSDELNPDLGMVGPLVEGAAGELGTVVAYNANGSPLVSARR